jgi:hypothetical protein
MGLLSKESGTAPRLIEQTIHRQKSPPGCQVRRWEGAPRGQAIMKAERNKLRLADNLEMRQSYRH